MSDAPTSLTAEERIAALDGVPVTLLPVRMETRFVGPADDPSELRVRVYPDQIHVDAHQPALTDGEVAAAQTYWRNRWTSGGDERARSQAAWDELIRGVRPPRAAWIVRQLEPTNRPGDAAGPGFPSVPRRDAGLDQPLAMRAMPDQWVLVGYDVRGNEVLRRWFDEPVADDLQATAEMTAGPPLSGDEAVNTYLGWAADYDQAVAAGMAVTVTPADLGGGARLTSGFGRLLVLGVDWTSTGADGAAALSSLFDAHAATDGLDFLVPGTPTNNLTTAPAAGGRIELGDPTAPPKRLDPDWSASVRLGAALGLRRGGALDAGPGAGTTAARVGHDVVAATWAATLGYFAEQLLFPLLARSNLLAEARDHAVRFLQPLGPLPTLRIGRQPLAVLPVVPLVPGASPSGLDPFSQRLVKLLSQLRPMWEAGIRAIPRLVGDESGLRGQPVERALLAILQRAPWTMRLRYRKVFGPLVGHSLGGPLGHTQELQATLRAIGFLDALELKAQPRIVPFVARPEDHTLRIPMIGRPAWFGRQPDMRYLEEVRALTSAADGRQVLSEAADADSLLEALVTLGALHELDLVAARVGRRLVPAPPDELRTDAWATPEITGIVDRSDASPMVLATTPIRALGGRTLAAETARLVREEPDDARLEDLAEFREALDGLATADRDVIDVAFRAYLDACSHRLDAWFTSVATRQLERVRAARPIGLHIGGYGCVENLRPEVTPDSLGYVAAPSLAHAATAGVLRSGHLAQRSGGHESLDVDLSSARVQIALELMRGVREGVTLAVLLGYRLERALRDADLSLLILPLRRVFPLRTPDVTPTGGAVEATPPNDVVDAAELLDRWRQGDAARAHVVEQVRQAANLLASAPALPLLGQHIDSLADTYDAVGDVVLAEAVHQTVRGHPERAQAAMRFLDRQEVPSEPDVTASPRTTTAFVHRVVVALGPPTLSAAWQALSTADPRAAAEPRVNAWVAMLLGDTGRWRFTGRSITDDGAAVATATVSLDQLELSPLALVAASAGGTGDQPTELEARIAEVLAAVLEPVDGGGIELLADTDDGLGLAVLMSLLSAVGRVLRTARPADTSDLDRPDASTPPGLDSADLERRADAADATLRAGAAALEAALDEPGTSDGVRRALDRVSRAGIAGAVPPSGLFDGPTGEPASPDAVEFASDVLAAVRGRLLDLDTMEGDDGGPEAAAALHRRRIATVFGDAFPVLGVFAVPADLNPSLQPAAQAALLGDDPLAAVTWLMRMAKVRPPLDALWHLLVAAEAATDGFVPTHFSVAQRPPRAGDRWAGLDFEQGDARPSADVAVVVHTPGESRLAGPIAGMVIDSWTEQLPDPNETAGLAFHYDAPSNRAPQVALIAVPPDVESARPWSLELLVASVVEGLDLSRLRGVTLQDLPAVGAVLPALYLPFDVTRNVPSLDLDRLAERLGPEQLVLGKD